MVIDQAIPFHFARKCKPSEGKLWSVVCGEISHEVDWYPHPEDPNETWFTHGWPELAAQLQLIEGDVIAIELISVSARKIRVTIFPFREYI